jgi:hypothetical protein
MILRAYTKFQAENKGLLFGFGKIFQLLNIFKPFTSQFFQASAVIINAIFKTGRD